MDDGVLLGAVLGAALGAGDVVAATPARLAVLTCPARTTKTPASTTAAMTVVEAAALPTSFFFE
jgi:hypothetical protein